MTIDLQRDAIEMLKRSDAVVVGPELIAQALKMSPGVLRKHVKDGDYLLSAVEVCGNRIRFFRKDFLQKIGEMPPDPPERTVEDRLDELIEIEKDIQQGIHLMCAGLKLWIHEKKTAGAATPTD